LKTEKTDRRVKYTKTALKQSLLQLLSDRPIGKITIKDICETADISRGTFYIHYQDQYDLLRQIQNEMDEDIKSTLRKKLANPSDNKEVPTEILICIAEQSALCKILFSDYGDAAFLKKIMYNAHDQFIDEWKTKVGQADIEQLNRFYIFTANGIAAVVLDWLQSGMKETPREIALFIENVIRCGLSAFVSAI